MYNVWKRHDAEEYLEDIVRGYSTTLFEDKEVYIKHLTPHDQVELEEIEERYFNQAKKEVCLPSRICSTISRMRDNGLTQTKKS